jgi:Zn-dependent protease
VPGLRFTAEPSRELRRPSPIFLGLVALCATGAWITWTGKGEPRVGVFVFVVTGWLITLCLHEFAHAAYAYRAGDRSVAEKGYLTLDPRLYSDVALSIVLPVIFVLLGGIGLPGGAVWIDRGRISGRLHHSLVSAAGPLTNIAFALLLLLPISASSPSLAERTPFWAALAYLGFLQVTASVLNLLPVPGLDGFGIVEPWLPREWVRQAGQISGFGILIIFALLWIPALNNAFFDFVFRIVRALGVEPFLVSYGDQLFRFWT